MSTKPRGGKARALASLLCFLALVALLASCSDGMPGATGPEGRDGVVWLQGPLDPSSQLGADGDLYLNTSTTRVFRRLGGEWTLLGALSRPDGSPAPGEGVLAIGPSGPTQRPGPVWIAGSGVPWPSTGKDGDLYLDTDSSALYERAAGVWAYILRTDGGGAAGEPEWIAGWGSPAAGTGIEGDFFIDTDAAVVSRKTAAGWGKVLSLRPGLFEDPPPRIPGVALYNPLSTRVVGSRAIAYSDRTGFVLDQGGDWSGANPSGVGLSSDLTFKDLAVNAARTLYVAVSADTILSSADGSLWTERVALPNAAFTSVAFGNGLFLAMGTNGVCYSSGDGALWTRIYDLPFSSLAKPIYAAGRWVCVGRDGGKLVIHTSNDGALWTQRYLGSSYYEPSLYYLNSRFLAYAGSRMLWSTDGLTWTDGGYLTDSYSGGLSIAYGAGRYVATSATGLSMSTDGLTWTSYANLTGYSGYYKVFFVGTLFYAFFSGGVKTSPNGTTWTDAPAIPSEASAYTVFYAYSAFWLRGYGTAMYQSATCATWTATTIPTEQMVTPLIAGPRLLLATSTGDSITTANGSSWARVYLPFRSGITRITAGPAGFLALARGVIYSSADGVSWTLRPLPSLIKPAGIDFADGLFVATGKGLLATSPDGSTWTLVAGVPATAALAGAASGGGTWVVLGTDGTQYRKVGAGAWTMTTVQAAFDPARLAYLGGRFVCPCADGAIVSSADGLAWTFGDYLDQIVVTDLAWADGVYVAVAGRNILSSPDAVYWTRIAFPSWASFRSLARGDGIFCAVARDGSSNGMSLVATSVDGAVWTYEYGNAFDNWSNGVCEAFGDLYLY